MYKLGESHIHGHGLIATEYISANTDVGLSHIGIGLLNGKVVAGEATDVGNFQNHSNEPNCVRMKKRIPGSKTCPLNTKRVWGKSNPYALSLFRTAEF